MKRLFFTPKRRLASHLMLWSSVFHALSPAYCFTQPIQMPYIAAAVIPTQESEEAKYTVNFNNTSIIEVIRFASKITGANFLFSESDLQFSVSIVSEDPISAKNFVSAIIQILRVNGLTLLEQDGNFLITQASSGVNQLSTVVSSDLPGSINTNAPIVTRVFRIKNTNPRNLASIIGPMTSSVSQIDVLEQTKQLIVTDITTNVEKIGQLILSLDTPHSNLEIETYVAKFIYPPDIISLTEKILEPFLEGNPLVLIPQLSNNTIFLISTPSIIERAFAVMEDIDILPSESQITNSASLTQDQAIRVYHIKDLSGDDLLANLRLVTKQLPPGSSPGLMLAIERAKYLKKNNSLVFAADAQTWEELEEILKALDTENAEGMDSSIWVYKIKNGNTKTLLSSLKEMEKTTKNSDLKEILSNVKAVPETNSLLFSGPKGALKKIEEIVLTLDADNENALAKEVFVYKVQKVPVETLIVSLNKVVSSFQDPLLSETVSTIQWSSHSDSLLFYGSESSLRKLRSILPMLDSNEALTGDLQFYMYQIKHVPLTVAAVALQKIGDSTKDKELKQAIKGMRQIEESNALMFDATASAIYSLEKLLPTIDVQDKQTEILTYQVKGGAYRQLLAELEEMAIQTHNKELLDTIRSSRFVEETKTIIFTGSRASIQKLDEILPIFERAGIGQNKEQFLIYYPKHQDGELLANQLREFAANLKGSGLSNIHLLEAIESMKWVPSSFSLVFTGSPDALNRIETMLQGLDQLSSATVFLYKPVYASKTQLQEALTSYAQKLDMANPSDAALASVIYQAEWVESSSSFRFNASPEIIGKLKGALAYIDSPKGLADSYTSTFFLYKVKNAQANIVIENLKTFAAHLPADDANSLAIKTAIENLRWIKENNGILITASSHMIEQIRTLLAEFDTNVSSSGAFLSSKGDFFIYKRLYQPPEIIQKELQELASDLKASSLADPDLIHTLETVKVVSATNSLLFTGTPDALEKVKKLLPTIDTTILDDSPIQTIGETTFLIYKVKKASTEELLLALKTFGSELSTTDAVDIALEKSLSSPKWIKETNSLLFTGSAATLERVELIVEKFDTGSVPKNPSSREAPTFAVYVPKFQDGTSLIATLEEFKHNLVLSGVADPSLFEAIDHLRFVSKTNSLIVSGDAPTVERVKELLERFDVSDQQKEAIISSIESANFLIYKLQYHQGANIVSSLKNVAKSLFNTAPDANKALIDAVDSLQWVEATNSLLVTGATEVLTKIKELIINLDAPLRQVFIEVLVIETSLFNTQNFGLQWGSQLQYLNKTIGAMGNFPTILMNDRLNSGNTPPGTINFANPLSYVTNTSPPIQGNSNVVNTAVPFSTGFDLGIIGDIIFHKGKSFITLGNLLNALQTDHDTTVVMNPKIITQDGRTSNIFVGQNIPFVGSFISNSASNTIQSSNIEYRDVGVNLTITPTLGTNNIVTLEIKQDISRQTPNTTRVQGAQVTGVQTSHTTMNTRVHVPDRHFLVLSGMIQDHKMRFRSGIPCLGGLPVIGALFAENDRADSKANVIIFLRPFIIDSIDEYERLTTAEEELYKESAGPHDLKEDIDAAIETIKVLDDE